MKLWMKWALLWNGLASSVGLLVLGASIVAIITSMQTSGVKNQVIVNFNHWTTSQYNSYVNSSVAASYYVFNITNIAAVLGGSASLLNVQEIGPLNVTEYTYKYEFDTSDPSTIQYKELVQYEIADAGSIALLSQPVNVLSAEYMGGIAAVAQQSDPTTTIYHPTTMPAVYSEAAFQAYYINQVGQQLGTTFLSSPASTLLPQLQAFFLPFYMGAALATIPLNATDNTQGSVQTLVASWAGFNPGHTTSYYVQSPAALQGFIGFELPAALSSVTVAGTLLNPTNPYSLLSGTGIKIWSAVLIPGSINTPTGQGANALLLQSITGLQQSDINTLVSWYSALVTPTAQARAFGVSAAAGSPAQAGYAATAYAGTSCAVLYKYMAVIGLTSPAYLCNSWPGMGALQFGTGLVGALLADPPINSTGTTAATIWPTTSSPQIFSRGWPVSFAQLANSSSASLTATWTNPLASSLSADLEPLELASALFPTSSLTVGPGGSQTFSLPLPLKQPSGNGCQLSVNTSTTILNAFGTVYPQVTGYLLAVLPNLTAAYSPLTNGNGAVMGGTLMAYLAGYQATAGYSALPVSVQSAITTQTTNLANMFATAASTDPFAYQCIIDWTVDYMGRLLTGTYAQSTAAGSTGVPITNAGLFQTLTVGQVLFGYQSKLGEVIPGYLANWSDLIGYQQYLNPANTAGTVENNTQQIAASSLYQEGKLYAFDSGQLTLESVGQIQAVAGASSFLYTCQRIDPSYQHECNSSTYRASNDGLVYNQIEQLTGAYDGTQFRPFVEGSANIQHDVGVYVSELRRVVPFSYQYETTYNGISLRRYQINNETFVNGTTGSQGSNPVQSVYRNDYKYNTGSYPNFLVNLRSAYNAVPIVGTNPHMLYANNKWVTGLNPTPSLHDTVIDVEPLTGKTMHVYKRLQGNMELQKSWFDFSTTLVNGTRQSLYANLFASQSQLIVPLYWGQVYGAISDSDASTFKTQIYTFRTIGTVVQIVGCTLGSIGIVLFSILLWRFRKAQRSNRVENIAGKGTYADTNMAA